MRRLFKMAALLTAATALSACGGSDAGAARPAVAAAEQQSVQQHLQGDFSSAMTLDPVDYTIGSFTTVISVTGLSSADEVPSDSGAIAAPKGSTMHVVGFDAVTGDTSGETEVVVVRGSERTPVKVAVGNGRMLAFSAPDGAKVGIEVGDSYLDFDSGQVTGIFDLLKREGLQVGADGPYISASVNKPVGLNNTYGAGLRGLMELDIKNMRLQYRETFGTAKAEPDKAFLTFSAEVTRAYTPNLHEVPADRYLLTAEDGRTYRGIEDGRLPASGGFATSGRVGFHVPADINGGTVTVEPGAVPLLMVPSETVDYADGKIEWSFRF